MTTIQEFIFANRLTMQTEPAKSNPDMDAGSTEMHHWRCVIRSTNRRNMTVHYSMGSGHHGRRPTLAEVLDCLASDASGYENAETFEDWAPEYGYDIDSRKAEKTFRTVERQAKRLRRFLGDEAYETLLWNTDRE